jgi:hypothetical protein
MESDIDGDRDRGRDFDAGVRGLRSGREGARGNGQRQRRVQTVARDGGQSCGGSSTKQTQNTSKSKH